MQTESPDNKYFANILTKSGLTKGKTGYSRRQQLYLQKLKI